MNCTCGRLGALELVTGKEIYPHRPDLHAKRFWLCRPCNAYVGCHPGTERPLGPPAGPALRQLRLLAHEALDPLWQSGRFKRAQVYRELSRRLGFEVHVGQSDEETCRKIIAECAKIAGGFA